jgi:Cu(I)/Ag(I) efflux system membrane fusion protein
MTTDQTHPTPPARRARRWPLSLVGLLGVALGAGGALLLAPRQAADGHGPAAAAEVADQYQCPMHPTIVQDHPGTCPICGMKLVKVDGAGAPGVEAGHDHGGAGGPGAGAAAQYQCPMHPTIVQDHPGTCPICGMKLVRAASAEPTATGERTVAFWRSPMDARQTSPTPRKDEMGMDYLPVYQDELSGSAPVEGLAAVAIDPARQQLIGLRTVEATVGPISRSLRTSGRVAVDETRVHHLNVKFSGFAEHVHADFMGRAVKRGEPLFSIYSPELLAAQDELVLALNTRDALGAAKGLIGDGEDLVAAARRKLELWDVPEADIARIERTRKAERTLTIRSPAPGVVARKDVVPGMKVEAGGMPYEIWDLSEVWVLADVYETELSAVKVGGGASLSLKAFPGRGFHGHVAFIDPVLDPQTRTAKVRIAFPNPDGLLKPEMFGDVVLSTPPRQALRIPADAVLDSGTRSVVFVAQGDGKFLPREVKLGTGDGEQVEVVQGLRPGDRVVTRANFLIDSESRLKASLQAMGEGR